MNWSAAVERQEKDPGDPEDTVFVGPHAGAHRIYHDSSDCGKVTPRRSMTRRKAQRRMLGPCRVCVLENVEPESWSNGPDNDLVERVAEKLRREDPLSD